MNASLIFHILIIALLVGLYIMIGVMKCKCKEGMGWGTYGQAPACQNMVDGASCAPFPGSEVTDGQCCHGTCLSIGSPCVAF